MKTKFDENVASKIPETRASQEPDLPWRISDEDIAKAESQGEEYRAAVTQAPPLQVRGTLLALMVVTIFFVIVNTVINIYLENTIMQGNVLKQTKKVSMLKTDLEKAAAEKVALNENASKLEKRINDLAAQKELFTAVIETLTKKQDDTVAAPAPAAPEAKE